MPLVNYLGKFKFVTHAVALGLASAAGWVIEHPEIVTAVVKAYPKTAILSTLAGAVLMLYHTPTK